MKIYIADVFQFEIARKKGLLLLDFCFLFLQFKLFLNHILPRQQLVLAKHLFEIVKAGFIVSERQTQKKKIRLGFFSSLGKLTFSY